MKSKQARLEAALESILKPLVARLKEEVFNLRIRTLETEIANIILGKDGKDEYLEKTKKKAKPWPTNTVAVVNAAA